MRAHLRWCADLTAAHTRNQPLPTDMSVRRLPVAWVLGLSMRRPPALVCLTWPPETPRNQPLTGMSWHFLLLHCLQFKSPVFFQCGAHLRWCA